VASVSTTHSTASRAVPMRSLQRETAPVAKIIAERLPKPQETRSETIMTTRNPRGASQNRDVDGCEYVDPFGTSIRDASQQALLPNLR
jgi:hypothetical protein